MNPSVPTHKAKFRLQSGLGFDSFGFTRVASSWVSVFFQSTVVIQLEMKKTMETRIWLTSDTHYNHGNIISYCNRPYVSIKEMEDDYVSKWNEHVKPEDTVYHLGDFAMGSGEQFDLELRRLRRRLVGKIVLIRGNHDRGPDRYLSAGFDAVHSRLVVNDVLLVHNPLAASSWKGLSFCGHVHEAWLSKGHILNVGVDRHDGHLIAWDDALRLL